MVKISGSEEESEQEHKQQNIFVRTYDISYITRVTRKSDAVVVHNKDKEMYKKVCCTCKVVVVFC